MEYEPTKIVFASPETYVDYDKERCIIRVRTKRLERVQRYLRRLIIEHRIGKVNALILRFIPEGGDESKLIHLFQGEEIAKFLYPKSTRAKSPSKKFKEIAKKTEAKLRLERAKKVPRATKITKEASQPIPAEPNEWTADAIVEDILEQE